MVIEEVILRVLWKYNSKAACRVASVGKSLT